mmetsp:Transcript_42504/g.66577  ORF Transcript_42504/g.66577 Transcript_42504/m.66577 type:complete len:399 (+) Transcript_42504:172-1368(+)
MKIFGPMLALISTKKGSLECYNLYSKQLLWSKYAAHKGKIWSIFVSQITGRIITGGSDGIVKFWEKNGNNIEHKKSIKLNEPVISVFLLKTCNRIMAIGITSNIYLFEYPSLKLFNLLKNRPKPVLSFSISDKEKNLVIGGVSGSLNIWNIERKNKIKKMFAGQHDITAVSHIHHNLDFLVGNNRGTIFCWNGNTYELNYKIEVLNTSSIWTIASSDTGNYIATGSADNVLLIWKVESFNKNWGQKHLFNYSEITMGEDHKKRVAAFQTKTINRSLNLHKRIPWKTNNIFLRGFKINKKKTSKNADLIKVPTKFHNLKNEGYQFISEFILNFLGPPLYFIKDNQFIIIMFWKILGKKRAENTYLNNTKKLLINKMGVLYLQQERISYEILKKKLTLLD